MSSVPVEKPNWQALYDTAASQEGLFTTRQAAAAGYSDPLLAHYQKVRRSHGYAAEFTVSFIFHPASRRM
jgi:hypothetical protein